jgi:hypothetical protein
MACRTRWSPAALVALVLGMFLAPAIWAQTQEGAVFQMQRGSAQFFRNGGATWLSLGPEPIAVRRGDKLRTGMESRGELTLPDGSIIRLQSGAVLTYLEDVVQMQVGDALYKMNRRGRPFQVLTPTSSCSVLGTLFDVSIDTFGKTRVRVFEGIVAVKAHDQKNRQLVLQKGMTTVVADRRFLSDQSQRFDVAKASQQLEEKAEKPRLGPSLPPIRPVVPMSMEKVATPRLEKKPTTATTMDTEGFRDTMNFFDAMGRQRMREYLATRTPQENPVEEVPHTSAPHSPATPETLRAQSGIRAIRGPLETRHQTERQTREEIERAQIHLNILQEEIRMAQSDQAQLRRLLILATPGSTPTGTGPTPETFRGTTAPADSLPPRLPVNAPSAGVPSSVDSRSLIAEKIRLVDERLRVFQEQHQRLVQRIHSLRNSLH